jgi:hypothetical protein
MDSPDNEPYAAALARCLAAARRKGHTVRVWYPVNERLHALLCEVCGAMAWVSQSGGEERWRIGGLALEQECRDSVELAQTDT